jgi:glycosyltransferase involved in cell wall biosynthesis
VKKPLLSVCVITYNQKQYIREAIDSLLEQEVTFQWELIIADDCSTDGTREILLEYKKKYPSLVHLILQKANVGPEKNWLDLISYPKTKYLLYTEGDDYIIDPAKLQRQVDFLEAHDDFSICFHPVDVTYENDPKRDEVFPSPEQRYNKQVLRFDDLLKSNFMQTNSVMYRWRFSNEDIREVFPKGVIPGDWFLHLLHAQMGKIGFINRAMSVYRRHPGGLWWDSHNDIDQIWRKYGLGHLEFYVEALALCGEDKSRRSIVEASIHKLLDTLVATDKKYQLHSFTQAAARFPDAVKAYAIHQLAFIAELQHKAEVARQEMQEAENRYSRLVDHQEKELRAIKNSKTWRLRNTIAKLLGRG